MIKWERDSLSPSQSSIFAHATRNPLGYGVRYATKAISPEEKKSSLWLNTSKAFQGVSSLQSLWSGAGDSDPVLEKADGPDDPSRSLGALLCVDARVHQPQGHLWSAARFCFQFSLHRKTLQHPTGCWPRCFGSTPSHLFSTYITPDGYIWN